MSSHRPSLLDTYSADFQKCPGWESLRLSFGSFSSMSASCVKVGLSLRSYAQQAERISWDNKPLWVSAPGEALSHALTGLWTMNDDRSKKFRNILISLHRYSTVIIDRSYTSRINMCFSEWLTHFCFGFNSQWPPCQGWSPSRPSLCPLRCPPARW